MSKTTEPARGRAKTLPRRAVVAFMAGPMLSICAAAITTSTASASSATGPSGTVTYLERVDNPIAPVFVKEFNATHPNLHVVLSTVSDGDLPAKLADEIRAGDAPDLVGIDSADISPFIYAGTFEKVTKYMDALSFKKYLNPGEMDTVEDDGQYYGFPNWVSDSVLFYNKTLFREAALNPNDAPANFAQILSDAKKITALGNEDYGFSFAGDCGGCLAFTMLPDMWAAGANIIKGNPEHPTPTVANNGPLKETLELYHTLWADKLVPTSDETDNGSTWGVDFLTGKIGMLPEGYSEITSLQQDHVKFSWGIAGLSGPKGNIATYDGGGDFAIPVGSKNKAGALEYVEWALQKAQQLQVAKYGLQPVRTDVLTPSFKAQYPLDYIATEATDRGGLAYGAGVNDYYHLLSGGWMTMFDDAVFKGQVATALQKGQSGYVQAIAASAG